MSAGSITKMFWVHSPMAMKNTKGIIPPESTRVGAQDGSHGNRPRNGNDNESRNISAKGETTGQKLQRCICGWTNVTSEKGLKIHQGRKKYPRELNEGPCIDQYFTRRVSELQSKPNHAQTYQHLVTWRPPSQSKKSKGKWMEEDLR